MKSAKLFKFPKDQDYVYLTKFSVGEDNRGQFNFRAGFSSALEGDERLRRFTFFYVIVTDDNWDEFMVTQDCSRKLALSKIRGHVLFNGDGYWSTIDTNTFINTHRTHVFYVAAINCNRGFHVDNPWLPKVWMEFKGFNAGEHFSQEDLGIFSMNIIMFILYIIFLGLSTYRYLQEIRAEQSWESPLAVLILALVFEFFQIVFKLIHLSIYEFDGEGIPTIDVFSTICQVGSQVFIVTLLLLISFGWTITYNNLPEKETIIMFTGMSFIIHAIIAGLTALDKDQYHKYHDFSGIQGLILVILRICLFIVFCFGINLSSQDIKKTQAKFLRVFTVAGSAYILAFPILYWVSYL